MFALKFRRGVGGDGAMAGVDESFAAGPVGPDGDSHMSEPGSPRAVSGILGLNHKRLYFMSDVYDIFVYLGGIERTREILAKCVVSPPDLQSCRLIDSCYQKVVKKTM